MSEQSAADVIADQIATNLWNRLRTGRVGWATHDEIAAILRQEADAVLAALQREGYAVVKLPKPPPELPEYLTVESRTGTSARWWCADCDFGGMWDSPRGAFDGAYEHLEQRHPQCRGGPVTDVVERARYTIEWGSGDQLHRDLLAEVERLRQQRTITTTEQLDALPIGSVVLSLGGRDIGDIYVNWSDHHLASLYGPWYRSGYEVPCPSDEVDLPARVLWIPEWGNA